MEDAQKKLGDALKAIKDAQEAIPSNFQDLAGDALPMLRRALMSCESHIQDGVLDIHQPDMLEVLDFLVKCSARKHRKAQVLECLGILLVKPAWGRVAASADLRSSLEALLEGQSTLLQILKTPVTEEEENFQSEKQSKVLSAQDQDLLGKALSEGREAMREAGWEYPIGVNTESLSDKAMAGFRSFYTGITKLDSSGAKDVEKLLEILKGDLPNLLRFLISLNEGRKSSRDQVAYVVRKLADLSPDFSGLMDQQATPWRSPPANGYPKPTGPQTIPSSKKTQTADDRNDTVSASVNRCSKSQMRFVLVYVGPCQPAHKGRQEKVGNDGLEVHRFHDDPSQRNTGVHIDVFTHIMDLVLNHRDRKEVVGVIIENAGKHDCIFQDIGNFFKVRSLKLPKFITIDKARGQSTDASIDVAANEGEALFVVQAEMARRESELS